MRVRGGRIAWSSQSPWFLKKKLRLFTRMFLSKTLKISIIHCASEYMQGATNRLFFYYYFLSGSFRFSDPSVCVDVCVVKNNNSISALLDLSSQHNKEDARAFNQRKRLKNDRLLIENVKSSYCALQKNRTSRNRPFLLSFFSNFF